MREIRDIIVISRGEVNETGEVRGDSIEGGDIVETELAESGL